MSIDLSSLSPQARSSYIRTGRQFGSPDTLAQANQTLQGLAAHGTDLVAHGFGAADAQRLTDARDALIEAGVGRTEARTEKKVTSATYLAQMKAGKAARASVLSILGACRRALHEQSGTAAADGVKQIDAALLQTRAAGDDAGALAEQLDVLRSVLVVPVVATAAKDRGGPAAVAELTDCASALRDALAARAGALGTPAETEYLDLLDGIVVTFARQARQAARAAAKRLGKPAMVADFELSKLYDRRAGAAPAKAPEASPPVN
jgi:hypothetical protein